MDVEGTRPLLPVQAGGVAAEVGRKDPLRLARRRRRRSAFLLVLAVACSVGVGVFRRPLFYRNFAAVDDGRVYRSAQPSDELEDVIAGKNLASVLNLRGGSREDPWYVHEVQVTRDLGVDFYDFPMNATRRPTRAELLTLIDLLGRCRYPLLIHCKSGSDRTGLVSALYLLLEKGLAPEDASRAFGLQYGHVPLFGTQRLHEPLDEYSAWLHARKRPHTRDTFVRWVREVYPAGDGDEDVTPLRPGPRPPSNPLLSKARDGG